MRCHRPCKDHNKLARPALSKYRDAWECRVCYRQKTIPDREADAAARGMRARPEKGADCDRRS